MNCGNFYNVVPSDKYKLTDFTLENINVKDGNPSFSESAVMNTLVKKLVINGEKMDKKK
jgi:hypothetical protein